MTHLRNPAVKLPTVDELRKISDELGLKCTEEELLFAQEHYKGASASYQKVFDMVEETPPVKYPRLPGHREKSDPACRGLVDMALGSDQGGSIRMPSSWCGIVGLKPTFGLVPYTGSVSLESTVDHLGPMTRTVDDCALLLEAIAGYDDGLDPRQHRDLKVPKYSKLLNKSIKGTKIAVLKEGFENVDDDVCRVVKATISKLQAEGAIFEDVSIPKHNDGVGYGWKGFYPTSLAEKLASSVKSRPFEIPFPLKISLMFGDYIERNYQKKFYCKAQNLRRVLCKAYDDVLEHHDVIVMPTTSGKPLKLPTTELSLSEIIDLSYGLGKNMSSFNITGHPAISVNVGFTDGLPCGMMIVGKMFDDLTVLQVAKTVENVVKK
ncbi:hypothetical protein FSP39_013053 [Pinctada imbricata]|uniref:Amidase domain-containing protein n=1 Tax=Pinctada imbricata TaxID=66713 RepID=A0AA88YJ54_PINIB|nr:hypothetical protein FSP39_013053 [Pinctada imbricata]